MYKSPNAISDNSIATFLSQFKKVYEHFGWPALEDGYCNVERRRSWTGMKLAPLTCRGRDRSGPSPEDSFTQAHFDRNSHSERGQQAPAGPLM